MNIRKSAAALLSCVIAAGSAVIAPAPERASAEFARASVHDPSVVKLEDGSYYIIGSHLGAARSTDLMNWTSAANSNLGSTRTTFFSNIYTDLAIPEKWSNTSAGYNLAGNMWAPDIIYNKDMKKYCMYLSVNGVDWHSSIVLCTADNIDGPYTYKDTIVYSGFETNPANAANSYKNTDVEKVLGSNPDLSRYLGSNGRWNAAYGTNAIDPAVFYDESGKLWMVYGSWFGGIYMLELDEQTGLRDYNVAYPYTKNYSDPYLGTHVAGGQWASGEGPYIEYMKAPDSSKGYYYLFLSYGYFNSNGGYNMRIFRSESPNGPYVDQNGSSAIFPNGGDNIGGTIGERLMSNYQWSCNSRPYKAQGHNSALMDDDGRLYVVYHTKFDDAYGFHEVRVHQMIMNEDGWPTAAAYEFSGESLSDVGHSSDAVVGNYEFIFHTLNQKFVNEQSADVEKPKNISLNADGTVSGDITGTWKMESGSPYMSLTFGGVTYKGAFLVQADESSAMTQRMTFTATGNNTCVWGSKKTAYSALEDNVDLMSHGSSLVYAPETASGSSSSPVIGDTFLLSGVSYFITSKNSGLVLDLAGGDTSDGTNIQQWGKTGGKHQEWRIEAADNGYCVIRSLAHEGKCLTVAGGSSENGANVELSAYTGADSQLWKLVQNGTYYGIVSKCSADAAGLDVYDFSLENGGNINQWEYWGGDCQLWKITPVRPEVPEGTYTFRNVNSSLYLAENSGSAVQSGSQQWTVKSAGNGQYHIIAADGRALTVENGSAENGADIVLSDFTGSTAQKFTFRANKDGSYALMTVSSGGTGCADVYNISTEDKANICQWEYWGGTGQAFVIEPAALSGKVIGDVNADGKFNIADIVMMQRYLLGDGQLTDSSAGDLLNDGVLDPFDLTLMRKLLISQS